LDPERCQHERQHIGFLAQPPPYHPDSLFQTLSAETFLRDFGSEEDFFPAIIGV
jgi:hypothetical protein